MAVPKYGRPERQKKGKQRDEIEPKPAVRPSIFKRTLEASSRRLRERGSLFDRRCGDGVLKKGRNRESETSEHTTYFS